MEWVLWWEVVSRQIRTLVDMDKSVGSTAALSSLFRFRVCCIHSRSILPPERFQTVQSDSFTRSLHDKQVACASMGGRSGGTDASSFPYVNFNERLKVDPAR